MALSKVIACSGAFSQTSSSASHFPSRSRVNVTHKKTGKIWWRDQKERKDGKESGELGGEKRGTIPSSSIRHQPVLRVIPPSRACVFRRKYNKTSGAAMRHQNGRFWLQRVFRCLRSGENRRYQQAVNNQCGNHARKTVSSQNANRHQISKGFRHTVMSHLSTFICSKWNGLKVISCYLLCHWDAKKSKEIPQVGARRQGRKTKKRATHKGFNRCLKAGIFMSLQKDFHQQIKDLLRSSETWVVLWHAERDVRIFSGVVLAHSWSIRLTLNSLKEIRLAHIQMHISSKTHSTSGPRRSAQETWWDGSQRRFCHV